MKTMSKNEEEPHDGIDFFLGLTAAYRDQERPAVFSDVPNLNRNQTSSFEIYKEREGGKRANLTSHLVLVIAQIVFLQDEIHP